MGVVYNSCLAVCRQLMCVSEPEQRAQLLGRVLLYTFRSCLHPIHFPSTFVRDHSLNPQFLAPILYSKRLAQMDETGCPTKRRRTEEACYDEEDPSLFWTIDAEAIHQALAMNGAPVQQGTDPSQSCNDFKQYLLNTLVDEPL